MFEPVVYDDGTIDYPYCDVCGRVLHADEELLPEKDGDGDHHWCSIEHSPEFMASILAYREFELVEAERVKEASLQRFLDIVRETVNDEIAQLRKAGKLK